MKNTLTMQWRVGKIERIGDDSVLVTFWGPTQGMNITSIFRESEAPEINSLFEMKLERVYP